MLSPMNPFKLLSEGGAERKSDVGRWDTSPAPALGKVVGRGCPRETPDLLLVSFVSVEIPLLGPLSVTA